MIEWYLCAVRTSLDNKLPTPVEQVPEPNRERRRDNTEHEKYTIRTRIPVCIGASQNRPKKQ